MSQQGPLSHLTLSIAANVLFGGRGSRMGSAMVSSDRALLVHCDLRQTVEQTCRHAIPGIPMIS